MSKRMLARVGGVAAVAALATQLPFLIRGDYSRQLVLGSTSPDGRYVLEVRRQVAFPALHNPSGTAYFAVIDARTHRPNAQAALPLRRVSDFTPATVQWTRDDVRVLNVDASLPTNVRLLLPR
jgi:hypothetical protein